MEIYFVFVWVAFFRLNKPDRLMCVQFFAVYSLIDIFHAYLVAAIIFMLTYLFFEAFINLFSHFLYSVRFLLFFYTLGIFNVFLSNLLQR